MTDTPNINPTEFELNNSTERGLNYDVNLMTKIIDLNLTADTTISGPKDALHNARRIWRVKAVGANRTLTLDTGIGNFRFGSDILSITVTVSGKTDYIGAIYNGTDRYWDVVAVSKGY